MKFCVAALVLLILSNIALSQRDYFTNEEVELIRDAQQIDKRVDIEVHAMDRRFGALNIGVNAPAYKEVGDWGTAPSGSRFELLQDIKHILQKSIDDIDNLSERPSSMVIEEPEDKKKKPKGFAEVFPNAVRNLAAAARRYQPVFKTELDTSKDPAEKGLILNSLEMCDEIIAAAAKLPAAPLDPKASKH
ncbi:MAG TPA: hypothetical protein VL501_09520 [Pyrinomonadaceae bacterium]|jgi:hypothetical protein|nr:hypothetical protein [Pyrinomonadaceae bacterium]